MDPLVENVLISLFASLVGAFVGAFAAFLLESRRRAVEQKGVNIASANAALFVLGTFYNELLQYQRDIVKPMEANGENFLRPTQPWSKSRPELNIASLLFLVHDGAPKVLSDLHLEQQRVRELFSAIEQFSSAHVYELQPRMAKRKVQDGVPLTEEEAIETAGIDLFSRLDGLSEYIVTDIEKTIRSLDDSMITLRNTIGKKYKKADLLEFRIAAVASNGARDES